MTDRGLCHLHEHPSMGKEVLASRDLEPGELIYSELPTLRIPSWPNDPTFTSQAACLTCGSHIDLHDENNCDGSSFKKCPICTWPLCSSHCQTDPIHETNECRLFASIGFKFPPPPEAEFSPKRIDWLILLVRAAFLKRRCPALYSRLMELQHRPQLGVTEIVTEMMDDIVQVILLSPPFREADLGIDREELLHLMWTVKLNGFTCSSTEQEERQVITSGEGSTCTMDCVYVDSSLLNNCCAPNCSYFTDNQPPFKIVIRTAVGVTKGQPLTINYFPYGCLPTSERQELIRSRYFFTCQCDRCQDPTEKGTFMEAIGCEQCQAEILTIENSTKTIQDLGYFLPQFDPTTNFIKDEEEQKEADFGRMMKCNRCSRTENFLIFSSMLQSLHSLVDELRPEMVQSGHYSVHSQDAGFLFDIFQNHVTKRGQSQRLHPNHWIVQLASQKLVDFYSNNESFETTEVMRNYKKLCAYLLAVQEQIFPGRSLITASLQLDLCSALFANLMVTNNLESLNDEDQEQSMESIQRERTENLNLCLETLNKALPVFESFQLDQDAGYYKVCFDFLTTVKRTVLDELQLTRVNQNLH